MALSWNEIKTRAIEFSKEWENDFNEHAEAKSFMDAFFNVFGIARRRVATFEQTVKKEDGRQGFIDLLWKGVILIEFKSRGKNLEKAHTQARDYFPGIKDGDLPKYILVCDFQKFRLYDLEEYQPPRRSGTPPLEGGEQENKNSPPAKEGWRDSDGVVEFTLKELVQNVQHFGYLLGYQRKVYQEQDPANIKAAELMGKLHDRLEEIGYREHPLEVYLVRILFCLFAEDTTIFNKQQFQEFIEQRTSADGSDLAAKLQELFQVLNTPKENRFTNLDEQLADFPYVNGKLFEEILPMASFDSKMRQSLLDCCYLDWSKISPAIFGSMFQSVMNPKERRNLGAHYTSETNILKLIKPLFLDDLWKEFESVKDNRNKLQDFHQRLSKLKFLDPACGCGNFLVITYRELRLLEVAILKALRKSGQAVLNVSDIILLDVDMMCGIEFEEFPARIAEVAMWLIDHQMNMQISNEFGNYFVRLPLKKSAKIIHGNALQIDWETVVSKDELSFILGNPPFLGHHYQNSNQKIDMQLVFNNIKSSGVLDYVSAWYVKAAQYIKDTSIKVAFVSTNSISQGEQAGILWNLLLSNYAIKIHFAHRTFSWRNEAKGNAAVHVVIIGFGNQDIPTKRLFEYEHIKGEPHEIKVKNINPYLVDASDVIITTRTEPISNVPKMIWGNKPTDGGNFLFDDETQMKEFIEKEPNSKTWIRPYISGEDLIHGNFRYCLWLGNIEPSELNKLPEVKKRVSAVRNFRLASKAELTRRNADRPTLFVQISQPKTNYLAIPEVSSEKRKYIPIGFVDSSIIASNTIQLVPNATLWHFGILTSLMHNIWMRNVCGRLKSDFRYSNSLVYNNYPFPENPTEKQIKAIETAAQRVLDARLEFPNSSLADLYDPLTMPPALVKAHNELDKSVDLAYRPQPFTSEANRMVFLFELYEKYTAGLFAEPKKVKSKK